MDGKLWFTEVPENTRWSNYSSPNPQDYRGVDFGVPTDVSDLRFYGYDDGGGVRPAAAYTTQYWTGSAWADVPHQLHSPQTPVGNGLNRITFPSLSTSKVRLLFTNPPVSFVSVSELQSWAPSDRAAEVSIDNGAPVSVSPGRTSTVTTSVVAAGQRLQQASIELLAPAGWTVTPNGSTSAASVKAGKPLTTSWSVTAPTTAIGDASDPLLAVATYRRDGVMLSTHIRVVAQIGFDPAGYSKVQLDDQFTTDTSSKYHLLQPFPAEIMPTLSVGGGALSASGGQPFFGLLDSGVVPASDDAVLILTAKSFIGTATNQDSLFLGLDGGSDNYVAGWYNNHFHSSGVDVVSGGTLNPPGTGTCCSDVTLLPGDQLALQIHGSKVTTYSGHGTTWTRLGSTDVSGAISASTLAGYHAMFGLRGPGNDWSAASRCEPGSRSTEAGPMAKGGATPPHSWHMS